MRIGRAAGVSALVLVLVAGAAVGGRALLQARDRAQQAESYRAGHAAFLAGSCDRALPFLAQADRASLDPEIQRLARQDRAACQAYAAVAGSGTEGDRLLALVTYLRQDDSPEPLKAAGRAAARDLIATSPPERLAGLQLCYQVDSLQPVGVVTADQAEAVLPALMLPCAATLKAAKDYDGAIALTQRLRALYPKSSLAGRAERTEAKLRSQRAQVKPGALTVDPWDSEPSDRDLSGSAGFVLLNSATHDTTITFDGPESRVIRLPACKGCPDHARTCDAQAPSQLVVLPPGRYRVVEEILFRPLVTTLTVRADRIFTHCSVY